MSAQQTIYDRIKKDLQDDKILQNVTLERLWYYLELIKDITGSGGASFTNGTGAPSGGADGDYYIRTDNPQAIYYNNTGTWEIVLVAGMNPSTYDPENWTRPALYGQEEISLDDAFFRQVTSPANMYHLLDQPIRIVNGGGVLVLPSGINHILTKVALKPDGTTFFFDTDCQAWVTALGGYVPCTYDVVTNTLTGFLTAEFLFSGQDDGSSTVVMLYNTLGATFGTPSYNSGTNKWGITLNRDIAKGGDITLVDVSIGTPRLAPALLYTPFAAYDNSSGNLIYFNAVDSDFNYSNGMWSGREIKITITAKL